MAWYGELAIASATKVTWDSPTAGMTDNADTGNVSVNYIANGTYKSKVATTGTWGSANLIADNTTLGSNQFRIKANSTGDVGAVRR